MCTAPCVAFVNAATTRSALAWPPAATSSVHSAALAKLGNAALTNLCRFPSSTGKDGSNSRRWSRG